LLELALSANEKIQNTTLEIRSWSSFGPFLELMKELTSKVFGFDVQIKAGGELAEVGSRWSTSSEGAVIGFMIFDQHGGPSMPGDYRKLDVAKFWR